MALMRLPVEPEAEVEAAVQKFEDGEEDLLGNLEKSLGGDGEGETKSEQAET